MSLATRNHLVITEGSNAAECLVDKMLEPAANLLAGENFALTDIGSVDRDQTFYFEDEHSIVISFSAKRMGRREDSRAGSYLSFNLTVVEGKPWREPYYWPESEEGDDLHEDSSETFAGLSLADDADGGVDDEEMRRIHEITEYYIDNDDYAPKKLITWNYYDEDGDLVLLQSSVDPLAHKRMLDENPDIDTDLQIKDACLSQSFSEGDSRQIIRLLGKLGLLVKL